MASVEGSQIPDEQSFMTVYWNFRKKFYKPEASDEYWSELVDYADEISKKFFGTEISDYVNQILLICAQDIEERYKKESGSKYVCKNALARTYNRLKRKESDP